MKPLSPWSDHLGDRLDHPERVPAEYQHLIADDQQRIACVLGIMPRTLGPMLEVGCSDGAMTRRLRQQYGTNQVTAMDLPQWDLRQPYPGTATYQIIYCCEVLEHLILADVDLALAHLRQALVRHGELIVTVPNAEPALHYTAGCRDRWRWPDHRSVWTYPILADRLRRHGFRHLRWSALYPPEHAQHSIWLMVSAQAET